MRPLPQALKDRLADGGRGLEILVVRLAAMGDILRTLPAARLLRRAAPSARIAWVVDDRWASLLTGHPDIARVIALPRKRWGGFASGLGGLVSLLRESAAWVRDLRRPRADLALDFHGNLRSACVLAVAGAPVRVGYAGHQQKEGNRFFTTHRVQPGPRRRSRVERNLDLVRALGVPDGPLPAAGLPVEAGALRAAEELVLQVFGVETAYAVLNPAASKHQAYKKPPAALLAAAAAALRAHGIAPLVVHGPGEESDARRVVEASQGQARVAPPTGIPLLAALLRRAHLFVGGDSGPLHLACAVGCPVVGLYGPTDPVVNAPWGVPHATLAPPGRTYSGVRRRDREAGGFEGLEPSAVGRAVADVLIHRAEADTCTRTP